MRVLIIGGTGHIGHYLTQHFVEDGADVVVIARGQTATAGPGDQRRRAAFWDWVRMISLDRERAETQRIGEEETEWQAALKTIGADIVIDLIAFRAESTRQTIEAIRGRARHFVNIGTGWRFGEPRILPTREDDAPYPRSAYGAEKQAMWELIRREFETNGFVGTQIDPPAIQGAPKVPNSPTGLRLLEVHQEIADGRDVVIPGTGETILGMVDVADVANLVISAVRERDLSAGEAFNAAADTGFTYNGLFHFIRDLFGSKSEARHLPLDEFERLYPTRVSRHHTLYHQFLSNEKASRRLGFRPQKDIGEALRENFRALADAGRLKVKICN